jgi:hypothetical protein
VNPRIRELLSRQKRSHQRRGAQYTFDLLASDKLHLPVLVLWGLAYLAVNKHAVFRALRLTPSPLTGEGWGGGENSKQTRTHFNAFTSPQPSPSRRGGNTGKRSDAAIKQPPWTGLPADRWSAPLGGRSDSDVGADISAGALATWGLQSGSWMRSVIHLAQVPKIQLRVNLRRRDAGVAEQLLHGAQVAAGLQQV